ncbi:hypothetical protein NC653_007054 [Populus alba x Populus x berolinensis]|uniref:Uncharacterized protein n=1 Tax=Populus alba x Populus x berolinensis TaxID=444605 RepID=A0AAD6RGZ2_9ROSI|nr:hypothetical protein NC653_007054 [Populus alba x Populus x berolinensis]
MSKVGRGTDSFCPGITRGLLPGLSWNQLVTCEKMNLTLTASLHKLLKTWFSRREEVRVPGHGIHEIFSIYFAFGEVQKKKKKKGAILHASIERLLKADSMS